MNTVYSLLDMERSVLTRQGEPPSDLAFECSTLVVYLVLYVQRHLAVLSTVSSVGVQWDRGLFDSD